MSSIADQSTLVPDQLLSPGVYDERQEAYVRALNNGLKAIDIQSFVMSDAQLVNAEFLPYLVREFSLQEFVEPGLKDEFVRNLLDQAYELHLRKGYVEGARLGLSLLGIEVSWTQWWQETPQSDPNTHKVTVIFDENLFEDAVMGDSRHQSAVRRMIDATKRWSQSVDINFIVRNQTNTYIGAFARAGGFFRHHRESHGDQQEGLAVKMGAVAHTGGLALHRRDPVADQTAVLTTKVKTVLHSGGVIYHHREPATDQTVSLATKVRTVLHSGGIIYHRRERPMNQVQDSKTVVAMLFRIGGMIRHRSVMV